MGMADLGENQMDLSLGMKKKYIQMNSPRNEDALNGNIEDLASKRDIGRSSRTRRYVIACSVFASLNNILLGYDVGVMSGVILFIKQDLNPTEVQLEIFVGILSVVSVIGSLIGGRTSDAIGRKWTMGLAAVVFQGGVAVMTFAHSFQFLIIGRITAGIGIGLGIAITSVYIAEISPTVARGSLTTFPEIFINIGILLGYVSNYAFSGLPPHINWRIMLGIGILPAVFIGFALFVIPESPRWLVMQKRFDEARIVLLKTNDTTEEAEERLAEIQLSASLSGEEKAVWREILRPSPALCRMLIAGIGISFFQQITGIDATVYYSPAILKAAGMSNESKLLAATVAVGVIKTAFIIIAIVLIDRVGRKPLLYISTIGMTICLFSLGAILTFSSGSTGIAMAIVVICTNVAFFSIGIGPIYWVFTSEIFPLRLRAQATALGAVANRICSGLIAMSFLSVAHSITFGGTFFMFSVLSAISVVFAYKFVPETKGKSLEQIEMLFQSGYQLPESEVQLGDAEHLVLKE